MENSSSELKEGATIAPSFSTEKIPPVFSAGRCYPVDQLGLVGPWDRTEQSVLAGSDAKDEGTDPVGPVGPDISFDQIQPVAEGPVGQYITRSPVGPEEMLSTCDSVYSRPSGKSELREMVLGETEKRGMPVCRIECTPEGRRPENISPGALQHVEMGNNQWNWVNYCCDVCGKANSVN